MKYFFKFFLCLLFLQFIMASLAFAGTDFKVAPNIEYGSDPLQKMDIFTPANAKNAPVILMVHGGGWSNGDKTNLNVVKNKGQYWLSRGYVFVSVNYRMLPQANPLQQADDVAKALAFTQKAIARWGGDGNKIILMGHSAGAHLVGLLSADPSIAAAQGAKPWKGSVLLDSAALDVEFIMQHRHFELYDPAFGTDEKFWQNASPFYRLQKSAPPMLLICSSQRMVSCPQAEKFSEKAKTLGVSTQILPQDLTHEQINETLGLPEDYTNAVDQFISAQLKK
jgi:arylformamidase